MLPMTVGNGNLVGHLLVKEAIKHNLSTQLLIESGFARVFLLGVSMGCIGFVGGFIFPIITVALIAGCVTYLQYTYLPIGLCLACFMAGLPGGICPMPFTLGLLAIFIYNLGLYQTAPVFISAVTSYTLVCGSGLLRFLQNRAKENAMSEEEKAAHAQEKQAEVEKQTEDELSLAKYLQSRNVDHTAEANI